MWLDRRSTRSTGKLSGKVVPRGRRHRHPVQQRRDWHQQPVCPHAGPHVGQVIRVNKRSVLRCTRMVLPAMLRKKWGRIVSLTARSNSTLFREAARFSAADCFRCDSRPHLLAITDENCSNPRPTEVCNGVPSWYCTQGQYRSGRSNDKIPSD